MSEKQIIDLTIGKSDVPLFFAKRELMKVASKIIDTLLEDLEGKKVRIILEVIE